MRCPYCGFEDPADMAFCAECGRPLRGASGPDARGDVTPPAFGAVEPAAGPGWAGSAGGASFPSGGYPHLVGLEGMVEGVDYPLSKPQIGIGRLPDCDISIPDAGVSRLHAWIRSTPGGFVIEDGGSANGTWVNGVQAKPSLPLAEHDVIRIGPCSFVFQLEEQQALPPGSMTMVSDVGEEPSVFGSDQPGFVEPPRDQRSTPPFTPAPWPPAVPVNPPAAPVAPSTPSRPPSAGGGESAPLQQQIATLRDALAVAMQSLDGLAGALGTLGSPAMETKPAAVRALQQSILDDPIARDAPDRYRELQALLAKLRSAPTDLKLLLQLSDQVPALSDLVEAYLRMVATLRDLPRG